LYGAIGLVVGGLGVAAGLEVSSAGDRTPSLPAVRTRACEEDEHERTFGPAQVIAKLCEAVGAGGSALSADSSPGSPQPYSRKLALETLPRSPTIVSPPAAHNNRGQPNESNCVIRRHSDTQILIESTDPICYQFVTTAGLKPVKSREISETEDGCKTLAGKRLG
jgi:hypothetical protein